MEENESMIIAIEIIANNLLDVLEFVFSFTESLSKTQSLVSANQILFLRYSAWQIINGLILKIADF